MATPNVDISKMSVEEMLALSKQLAEAAQVASQKEFDTTMTTLHEKLKRMGRTKEEVVTALFTPEELEDYITTQYKLIHPTAAKTRKPRAPGSTPARKPQPYEAGVEYRGKNRNNSWTGGSRGKRPTWLTNIIPEGMDFEEAKAKYKEMAVQK